MSDTTDPTPISAPTARAREHFVIVSLLLFGAMFVATTFWGVPTNSLHTSAQSWSVWAFLAIFGLYALGVKWDSALIAGKP